MPRKEQLKQDPRELTPADPMEELIGRFARFQGVGRKNATRMAYQVMAMKDDDAEALANAIRRARTDLHRCRLCQDYTPGELCRICASPKRDRTTICVV